MMMAKSRPNLNFPAYSFAFDSVSSRSDSLIDLPPEHNCVMFNRGKTNKAYSIQHTTPFKKMLAWFLAKRESAMFMYSNILF